MKGIWNKRVVMCAWVCLLTSGGALLAQDNGDFESFRSKMLSDFQGFRKSVLDNYADYLDGIWKEYTVFAGAIRSTTPKPKAPIVYEEPTVGVPPVDLPSAEPTPSTATPADQTPAPRVPVPVLQPVTVPKVTIDYYGMKWALPRADVSVLTNDTSKDCAALWRTLDSSDVKTVVPALQQAAAAYGLNDWFTLQLVRMYADTVAASCRNIDRVVLQHYLLTHMGYDVRLARSPQQYFLLVPFTQTIYARNYLKDSGDSYYVFEDEADHIADQSTSIYTYDLPGDIDSGRKLSLRVDASMKIHTGATRVRQLQVGVLTILGDVDATMMEMLRHYPLTDIPVYASSIPDPALRNAVLSQFHPYVEGKSEKDAVNILLHFVQYAFNYATDDEQHGYEKPYFFEENFYYPMNDCEDRAMFFAYLVRHLLHLDVHLVRFPGHECTAVHFTDASVTGDGYLYNGKRYLICDPTYIGARLGTCMPDFRQIKPTVEEW